MEIADLADEKREIFQNIINFSFIGTKNLVLKKIRLMTEISNKLRHFTQGCLMRFVRGGKLKSPLGCCFRHTQKIYVCIRILCILAPT